MPMKAEIIQRDDKLTIEIPVDVILARQDEVLKGIVEQTTENTQSLTRVEETVRHIKELLDESRPWAASVEKRFQEQGQDIAVLKSDMTFLKSRVKRFHDGD